MKNEIFSAELIGEAVGIPFDANQRAIISADLEPGVVIAGAGSGKTSVMAARVVYLVANGYVTADQILGLTFTNLATGQLQKSVRKSLLKLSEWAADNKVNLPFDLESGEPTVMTYHSFSARLVKEHGLRIGIEPDSTVLSDARREQLAAYVIQRTKLPLATSDMPFSTVLKNTLDLDDALSDYNLDIERVRSFDNDVIARIEAAAKKPIGDVLKISAVATKRNHLLDVVKEFREYKRLTDHLDYADMSRLALELAKDHEAVRQVYGQQFQVVLLDEYQDTSVSQRELMRHLFDKVAGIMAVGDPLQSIYTFRGASPYNIEEFVRHFPKVDGSPATRFNLPVTRRNGHNIVALANAVSERLRQPDAHPGVEPLAAVDECEHGIGNVHVTTHLTSSDETDWLVEQFRTAHGRGVAFEEMAVLLRTNDDVAWFYRELGARDIPVQIRTKQGLLSIPEIAELVAYLRVIAEPAANAAWVRILTGPRWRIGNRDLALIGRLAYQLSHPFKPKETDERTLSDVLAKAVDSVDSVDVLAYGDALEDIARNGLAGLSAEALDRIRVLVKDIEKLRRHTSEDLVDFVFRVGSSIGLFDEAHAHSSRIQRNMASNLRVFMNLVADFRAIDGSTTLFSLLRFLKDSERHDKMPDVVGVSHKGAVELMTVHSAKGLEYKVVALPRFSKNVFPTKKGADRWTGTASALPFALRDERVANPLLLSFPQTDSHISTNDFKEYTAACQVLDEFDERRLAYVAITRAMETVLVSAAYFIEGEDKMRETSAFFDDLKKAADLLTQQVQLTPWVEPEVADDVEPIAVSGDWPVPMNSDAMRDIREAAELVNKHIAARTALSAESDEQFARWDSAIAALEAELLAAADYRRSVELPRSLSVTEVQSLAKDEAAFLDHLVRPMPKQPAPAAAQGTTFHAWVEQRARVIQGIGSMPTLPGMEDYDTDLLIELDTANLKKFQANFENSEWATKSPYDVEKAFNITIAGRLIRGKIDAIYKDGDNWILVDWKTNSEANADPLQLSIYRVAWAEMFGVEPETIKAAFYYVALNQTVYADKLLSRDEIGRLLS